MNRLFTAITIFSIFRNAIRLPSVSAAACFAASIGRWKYCYFFLSLFLWSGTACADLAVIVHPDNAVNEMNKRQVTDLFMGSYSSFPDGTTAIPIDHPAGSAIRSKFYQYFTGKSVPQINAYWAKLIFSGRATPPRVAPDSASIPKIVAENKNAIAYMDSSLLTSEVKVVYIFKE